MSLRHVLRGGCGRYLLHRGVGLTRNYSAQTTTVEAPAERLRRSLFYVPGSEERKIRSSFSLKADCLVYDLEDSVALGRKGAARSQVYDALQASPSQEDRKGQELAVRINAVASGMALDDLDVTLRSPNLQAIVIPKVQSASDVLFVRSVIEAVAPESSRDDIRLIASIESAMGLLNLREICQSHPSLDALIFAAEDYCADLGLVRTPHRRELYHARSQVVTHAVAYGLQSIDLVCLDFHDPLTLKEECEEGREMGFTGKQAIHPKQIGDIQDSFCPHPKDIDRAVRILEVFDKKVDEGIGAFEVDGKVVDLPVVKWADRIVRRAISAGADLPNIPPLPTFHKSS